MLSAPEPLKTQHVSAQFDCGEPALNNWLQQKALKNESRFSRSYVVCNDGHVAGYYCISAGSVQRQQAPSRLKRNAPDPIPVAIIGRLAVDRNFHGKGLGKDLLADAMRRIALSAQNIGIAAIMVQAKNASAKDFYMACAEFLTLSNNDLTLFLPIETVMAGLS
jgi:GNAT superfamily N-acetyltransferase